MSKAVLTLLKISIVITVLVFMAGSIVRTTGSGLGCPDWPKCFGTWIPPTDVSQLPANYKEVFSIGGKEIADFSAFKTWTEYLNRLVGVFLGFVLLILTILSWKSRHVLAKGTFKRIATSLFLVVVQGGVGALVVATHLEANTISIHFALAIFLVFLLQSALVRNTYQDIKGIDLNFLNRWRKFASIFFLLMFVQFVMGLEVRKTIDHFVHQFVSAPRSEWADHLTWIFYVHRTFSIFLVLLLIYWMMITHKVSLFLFKPLKMSFVFILISVVSGIALKEFGFPAAAQPVHLVGAVVALFYVNWSRLVGTQVHMTLKR